jgi:hypothetical protein
MTDPLRGSSALVQTASPSRNKVENMVKLQPLEPRNLALAADLELEGAWRVEYFDSRSAAYITIFAGQSAELRARDYYDAIERGGLSARIANAQ